MIWLLIGLGSAIGGMASHDAFRMLEIGQCLWALLYVSLSLAGGLVAVYIGQMISR